MFKSHEQKHYEAACDFNANGVIDEEDLRLMKKAKGKSYKNVEPEEWNAFVKGVKANEGSNGLI